MSVCLKKDRIWVNTQTCIIMLTSLASEMELGWENALVTEVEYHALTTVILITKSHYDI